MIKFRKKPRRAKLNWLNQKYQNIIKPKRRITKQKTKIKSNESKMKIIRRKGHVKLVVALLIAHQSNKVRLPERGMAWHLYL